MKLLIQILAAFIACCVFSILYNVPKNKVVYGGLGGAISWIAYSIFATRTGNIFLICMFASIIATAYAEGMARYTKKPAAVYLIPSILPLVPGGSLYYATNALVTENNAEFAKYGRNTVFAALGIAIGIVIVSIIVYYFNHFKKARVS